MKKLSEIGRTMPMRSVVMTHDSEVLLSIQERRQLVRRAIKKFLVGHMLEWRRKCELSTALDKFCKEQDI